MHEQVAVGPSILVVHESAKRVDYFIVGCNQSDLVFHVVERNTRVFGVVRIDALNRYRYADVSLISIDRSHPNTRMRVDASQRDVSDTESAQ